MHYPYISFSLPSFLCLPYPWSNTVPFSRCAQEIMHVGARAHSLAFAFALALCRLATVGDPRDTNNDYASTTWSGSCCHMVRLCRSSVDHNNCGSVLKIHTADTSWAAILLPTHTVANSYTHSHMLISRFPHWQRGGRQRTQTTPSLTAWLSPQQAPGLLYFILLPFSFTHSSCIFGMCFFNQLRPFFWHFHFLCDPSGVSVAVSLSLCVCVCVLRGGHVCGKAVVRPAVGTHLLPLPLPLLLLLLLSPFCLRWGCLSVVWLLRVVF